MTKVAKGRKPPWSWETTARMVSLVARQFATREITEKQAYNHVCDIGMLGELAAVHQLNTFFETELERFGGRPAVMVSIPMRITCPGELPDGTKCGRLHIDEGEWATKPHHTHSCQHCGMTFRPAVPYTVGVAFLPGFKNAVAGSK